MLSVCINVFILFFVLGILRLICNDRSMMTSPLNLCLPAVKSHGHQSSYHVVNTRRNLVSLFSISKCHTKHL